MRSLLIGTTALAAVLIPLAGTGATAGGLHHDGGAVFRPSHGFMGGAPMRGGYRGLPPVSGVIRTGPSVVYGHNAYAGRPSFVRGQGFDHVRQGTAPRQVAGGYGYGYAAQGGRDVFRRGADRMHERDRRGGRFGGYGYGLAGAAVGGVAGYGLGYAGGGYDGGYAGGYGGDVPQTGGYGEAAEPRLSGGDDVQTNGYGSPYNPYQQAGYASGSYGSGGYSGYGSGGYGGYGGYGFSPAIPPAGGLAVYSPGAYGPGPRIIHIPAAYGASQCTCSMPGY